MNTKNAVKATYHFYLTQAVLKTIAESGQTVGDIFGIGEDTFVTELYPYSNLLYRCVSEHEANPDCNWKESDIFETVNELAELFMAIVERDTASPLEAHMPDIVEFELDIKRIL